MLLHFQKELHIVLQRRLLLLGHQLL